MIVKLRHGGYADEVVVAPAQLTPLPSTFDYAEGATFLAAHGTAYHALIDRGALQPGEVLLVHGAGGGVGLAAVEIGKLLGATVIAAASSEEKLAVAQRARAPIIWCCTAASRSATPSSASPRVAAPTWCSIPSAARFSRTACAASPGARACSSIGFTGGIGLARTNLVLIKGASVLGVRAGEAVRKNPALGDGGRRR